MTSRDQIESAIRKLYAARAANDIEACVSGFAPQACFRWAGSQRDCPLAGEASGVDAVRAATAAMMDAYAIESYEHREIVIDGENAAVLTDVRMVFRPTGERFSTELFDLWTFRDGQVVGLTQFGDTALAARHVLESAPA